MKPFDSRFSLVAGAWTKDWKEAKRFVEIREVFSEIRNHDLAGIEYVLIFDDLRSREHDIVLSLKYHKNPLSN